MNQTAIPWVAPLAGPKPMATPVPMGMTPPIGVMVEPNATPEPDSKGSGSNHEGPPPPVTTGNRPECIPELVPHLGGDALHNRCADGVPLNAMSGFDVRVNGKRFDAMQSLPGTLWEVKTDNFEAFTVALRGIVIKKQVTELRREREIARACGYAFAVGVRSKAHQDALLVELPTYKIVLMDWC
jgi:hypothetical protein